MYKLKLALLGAAMLASAGALSSANAADVYARGGSLKDGPVAEMPAISWTGFYVGVHVGGVFDDSIEFTRSALGESISEDFDVEDAWLAGVHVGYNWQISNVVLGVEADWSALSGKRDVEIEGFKIAEQDDNWLASVRGRLGFAVGPALVYGTGGVAFLNSNDSEPFEETVTGWVAGGGVEYKLSGNWSLGLEGLYYAFEDEASEAGLGFTTDLDYDREFWTVRARLTYQFADSHDEPLK